MQLTDLGRAFRSTFALRQRERNCGEGSRGICRMFEGRSCRFRFTCKCKHQNALTACILYHPRHGLCASLLTLTLTPAHHSLTDFFLVVDQAHQRREQQQGPSSSLEPATTSAALSSSIQPHPSAVWPSADNSFTRPCPRSNPFLPADHYRITRRREPLSCSSPLSQLHPVVANLQCRRPRCFDLS